MSGRLPTAPPGQSSSSLERVPRERIPEALGALEKTRAVLWSRLMAERAPVVKESTEAPADQRLLTAREVTERLGTSARWVYRHAKELGVVQLSEHKIRFSEAGVRRFLKRQVK